MYQEHLHKLTLDKDNQTKKDDDNNKNLKTQLTKSEAENQKLCTAIDDRGTVGKFRLVHELPSPVLRNGKKYIYILYSYPLKGR